MFPLQWNYPASGPAPPTPHVVLGAPVDPTPLSPPQPRTAPIFANDAPCPATPYSVPYNQPEVGTYQSSNGSSSSAELTPDAYQWPSPVMAMIQRAALDSLGRHTQPIDLFAGPQPGHIEQLLTIIDGSIDFLTFQYYDPRLFTPSHNSDTYPIRSIEAVQRSLNLDWSSVVPQPIPPVIIRLRDLVGHFYDLRQRADGYAFVVPAADSIWADVLQRGVDSEYRSINPEAAISTNIVLSGKKNYNLQHTLASAFAVNVFLEIEDTTTGQNPQCKYMGAHVLQLLETATISRFHWGCIDPREQQTIFERIPERFTVYKDPLLGWPHLPLIQFRYYTWDKYILGMADKSLYGMDLAPAYIPLPGCPTCARSGEGSTGPSSDNGPFMEEENHANLDFP